MGLGDSVEVLLETYAKCLSLLRVFSSSSKESSSYSDGQYVSSASSDWDRQSELGRSLRSDRAKIQKAYSARLSETGSRLEKGDGPSRSALRRIVRRLTDALASILGFGSGGGSRDSAMPDGRPLLNYDALRALSNASRIDAVHAIDEASVRLSGHTNQGSRSSVSGRSRSSRASSGRALRSSPQPKAPPASASTSAPLSDGHQRRHESSTKRHRTTGSSSGSSHGGHSSTRRGNAKTGSSSRSSAQETKHTKKTSSSRETAGQARAVKKSKQRSPSRHRDSSHGTSSGRRSGSESIVVGRARTPQKDAGNRLSRRVSMVSSSSASTKLGEIPEHKLRRRPMPTGFGDEVWDSVAPGYNIRPAYPMRPLWEVDVPEPEKPKKRFWGMFS